MLCPEGEVASEENVIKGEEKIRKKNKIAAEGGLELNSFINPKTWKKSISNFFRHQLRSTKSNDGDATGSNENFEEKDIPPDQKWQSLGKIFRRQSFSEHWAKSTDQQGEGSTSQNKRAPVRKVLSSYFGKSQKSLKVADEK